MSDSASRSKQIYRKKKPENNSNPTKAIRRFHKRHRRPGSEIRSHEKGEGGRELIGGNIDESLGNYRDKFGELLIVGDQARKELLRISTESKKLSEQQKKELEELAVNIEDSVEGYTEMANKIREIKKLILALLFLLLVW